MQLQALLADYPHRLIGESVDITDIVYDSRKVTPGSLFVAVSGFTVDGHAFAAEAQRKQAAAVLVERPCSVAIPQVIAENTRDALGVVSAMFFGNPSHSMRVIGVTGTNGKTTTTYLIKAILEAAGFRVGLIGTIQNMIADQILPAHRTTPESVDLQRLFSVMRKDHVDYAVMEVSSHALALKRTVGTEFDIGVFTNLTQDHLDFHSDFDAYLAAKSLLFSGLTPRGMKKGKAAVINGDDPHAAALISRSAAPVLTYGLSDESMCRALHPRVSNAGVEYHLASALGDLTLSLALTGRFNVYNSLAAACATLLEGLEPMHVKSGLEEVQGVPGRFEAVRCGQDFAVIVDYAHTPDGLENALETARSLAGKRRVITVMGAGGDRDRTKRPCMGETAGRLSDLVIVTSDNPRTEEPSMICRDIEAGLAPTGVLYEIIVERSEAIEKAVRVAQPGDLVLIAGKGHETYQEFSHETIHFDDREAARIALKERLG